MKHDVTQYNCTFLNVQMSKNSLKPNSQSQNDATSAAEENKPKSGTLPRKLPRLPIHQPLWYLLTPCLLLHQLLQLCRLFIHSFLVLQLSC